MKKEYVLLDYIDPKVFHPWEFSGDFSSSIFYRKVTNGHASSSVLVITLTDEEAVVFKLKYSAEIETMNSFMEYLGGVSNSFEDISKERK